MITRTTKSGRKIRFESVETASHCSMCFLIPKSGKFVRIYVAEVGASFYFCRACCKAMSKTAKRKPIHRVTPIWEAVIESTPNMALETGR